MPPVHNKSTAVPRPIRPVVVRPRQANVTGIGGAAAEDGAPRSSPGGRPGRPATPRRKQFQTRPTHQGTHGLPPPVVGSPTGSVAGHGDAHEPSARPPASAGRDPAPNFVSQR